MSSDLATRAAPRTVANVNDDLRRNGRGGRVVVTPGIAELSASQRSAILRAVAAFDAFTPDDDPYAEHDFGALTVEGRRVFFKIDPYDLTLTAHSPDPADPAVTCRVMTLMLAEEY